jgi:predicted transcriptional regulator
MDHMTETFLEHFNRLESALKTKLKKNNHVPYSVLVHEASLKDVFIKKHKSMLNSLGDLRNVLVHGEGNDIIAIPSEAAVSTLIAIVEKYASPTPLYNMINHKVVRTQSDRSLADALILMRKHDYTKIPVYNGHTYIGLLSGNIVARWMANHIEESGEIKESLKDVTLETLLTLYEKTDTVVFIPKDMDIYDFIRLSRKQKSKLSLYIMTQTGDRNEKPLGIITAYDYPRLLHELEL